MSYNSLDILTSGFEIPYKAPRDLQSGTNIRKFSETGVPNSVSYTPFELNSV